MSLILMQMKRERKRKSNNNKYVLCDKTIFTTKQQKIYMDIVELQCLATTLTTSIQEDWQCLAKALTANIQEDILFRLASPVSGEKVTSVPIVYEWLEKDDEELDLLLGRHKKVAHKSS